ncbi:uncharacterized protein [Antedon mediterranea]|uniref:uncharacterized protein n=1 Tax=Antedon mediterranea TaxID=105859 RepID=UPI003AF7CC29
MTASLKSEIDVFQRKFLKRIIGIRWPEKIKNEDLYKRTGEIEWNKNVKKRRLTWYGHLLRLNENTPAKIALGEAQRKTKKPKGRPKTTWMANIKKETELFTRGPIHMLAKKRTEWRTQVRRAMSNDD